MWGAMYHLYKKQPNVDDYVIVDNRKIRKKNTVCIAIKKILDKISCHRLFIK